MSSDTHPDPQADGEADSGNDRRSNRQILAIGSLAILTAAIGIGAYAMFGPNPAVPEGMLTATADDHEPSGYHQEGDLSAEPVMTASAVHINSRKHFTHSVSSTRSNGDRLFDRTLAVYNEADDLLMQRLGLALFEQLKQQKRFEQLHYLPAGDRLPDGQRLPDLFITLDRTDWEESGLPGNRHFTGTLQMTISDRFRRASQSYSSTLSPPKIEFRWRGELEYEADQTGIETSGARYQAVSNDIAGELAQKVNEAIDKLSEQYGVIETVPESFYVEYLPPPDFEFVDELNATRRIDGSGFMKHAVVIWETPDNLLPPQAISAVREALSDGAWRLPEGDQNEEYLRATSGSKVITVFRDDAGTFDPDAATRRQRMFVVYEHTMAEEAIHAGVRRLFDEEADESALLLFQRAWYEHPELVEEYFAEQQPSRADSWLQLAQLRKKSDPEAAREALLRAHALYRVIEQQSPTSAMKRLAEELGIEKLPGQISHEMIQRLGVGELPEDGEIELTVREDQPAPIWLGDREGEQQWLLLTPIRRHGIVPEQTLRLEVLKFQNRGWSRSDQTSGDLTDTDGPIHRFRLDRNDHLEFFSTPLPDQSGWLLTLRRPGGEHAD